MKTILRRKATALAALLPLCLLLTGCATDTAHRSVAAATLSGGAGFFPTQIIVDKEDKVVLRVGNGTDRTHGFSIEGYKIARTVDPNQTLVVKFVATRGGTFKIFCQLHPTHQTATLVVE